jgi:hypothetical protein
VKLQQQRVHLGLSLYDVVETHNVGSSVVGAGWNWFSSGTDRPT